jgi:hypothetical protein
VPVAQDDRNAAASDGHRHRWAVHEHANALELDDLERLRGGYDPAPTPAGILGQRPVSLALELRGLLLAVEGANRLRRILEGRVVLVYNHARHEYDRFTADRGGQLGRDQSADLGLGLRDRKVERERGRLRARQRMPQKLVPNLRPIPVGQHDRPFPQERRSAPKGRG